MDYKSARRLLSGAGKDSGLVVVKERRHVTIPYHMLGNGKKTLSAVFDRNAGHYRDAVKGVVLAVGSVKAISPNSMIIGTQQCVHLDVDVTMVVFRPKIGETYQAVVTKIDKKTAYCKLYDTVTVTASRVVVVKQENKSRPEISVGLTVNVLIEQMVISKKIVHLKGRLLDICQQSTSSSTPGTTPKSKQRPDINKILGSSKAPAVHIKYDSDTD